MTFGIVHQFAGGTKEQYEATLAAVHPGDGSPPAHEIFHAAGPSETGWTIVGLYDSEEGWETFRDTQLVKAQGIPGGFTSPPQETTFDVVNRIG